MDNLFAVVGKAGLRQDAEMVLKSLFTNATPHDDPASIDQDYHRSFARFIRYSQNRGGDFVITSQQCAASSACPVLAIARLDDKQEMDQGSGCEARSLIQQLYRMHGEQHMQRLRGNFCYVLWDEEKQELHAAIDPFSARNLFYLQVGGLFYIASDARLLALHPRVSVTANRRALAQWLRGQPDPFVSMFNEMGMLPGGHRLRLTRNNDVHTARFWDIDPDHEIRYSTTPEYTAHFLELLSTSVRNRMQSRSGTIFSQMSGGMDSTSITALAITLARDNQQQLHTVSHCYRNTASCDELEKIQHMVQHLQLRNTHYVELDGFADLSFRALYPSDFDNPGIVHSPKYQQELSLIQDSGADVLLTGNGGDEACWGHSASYRARLLRGELGVIAEVVSACGELNEPIARSLRNIFLRPLATDFLSTLYHMAGRIPRPHAEHPPWLAKQAVQALEQESAYNPYSASFSPAKHARYASIRTTSTYNSMRSYQKVANHYGVDVRHPFFDPALVEFSFAVPEKLLIQGIYPKWLLRKTMEPYLPAEVCWNRHKVIFDQHFANLLRRNAAEIRQLLSHTALQDLGLVNNAILLSKFDAVANDPAGQLNVDLLYAILTQSWFQQHALN